MCQYQIQCHFDGAREHSLPAPDLPRPKISDSIKEHNHAGRSYSWKGTILLNEFESRYELEYVDSQLVYTLAYEKVDQAPITFLNLDFSNSIFTT